MVILLHKSNGKHDHKKLTSWDAVSCSSSLSLTASLNFHSAELQKAFENHEAQQAPVGQDGRILAK